jgi:hypothetical protein
MRRKRNAAKDEMDSVAQRLRSERPEASPLELDRIKTTAMSRARAAGGSARTPRRLAVAALTVGLMAAGTGGVIAAGGAGHSSSNAATAQYGGPGNEGTNQIKPTNSKRTILIHIRVPSRARLERVTVMVNGKVISVLRDRKASAIVSIVHPLCGKGATTIVVIAVTNSGKTITERRRLHLCQT